MKLRIYKMWIHALSVIFLFCGSAYAQETKSLVQDGLLVVDDSLSDIDSTMNLDGKWLFFPGMFLSPEQIRQGAWKDLEYELADVPTNSDFAEREDGAYGSYLIEVENFDRFKGPIGLYLVQFQMIAEAYWFSETVGSTLDEAFVGGMGKNAERAEERIPQLKSVVGKLDLLASDEKHYLLIHHSGYWLDGTRMGFMNPIHIAPYEKIVNENNWQYWQALFVLGMFFLITVTNFNLFLQRTEDKASLLIASFSFIMGLRYLATEAMLGRWLEEPQLWYFWSSVATIGSALQLGMVIFLAFLAESFSKQYNKKYVRIFWALTLLTVVIVWADPGRALFSIYPAATGLLIFVMGIYLIVGLAKAVIARERGSLLSVSGIMVLILGFINDTLAVYNSAWPISYISHYCLVAFIFIQSTIVGRNFAFAFRTADKLSRELQLEVERQTRDIKSILNNINQGIFTLGKPENGIGDDHSRHLKEILEIEDIAGRAIDEVLLERTDLNDEQKSYIHTVFESCLGEPEFAFETNAHVLASEFKIKVSKGREKIIAAEWAPIVNERTDEIEKILVALKDVTEVKALEAKAKENERQMRIISEILEISEEKFAKFIKSSRSFLEENRRLIQSVQGADKSTLKILFINMHTMKGAARSYKLTNMTDTIHRTEQFYAELQKEQAQWDQSRLLSDLDEVEAIFAEYETVWREKLGHSSHDEMVEIDMSTLKRSIAAVQEMEGSMQFNTQLTPMFEQLRATFFDLYYKSAETIFNEIFEQLPRLAKDLSKLEPRLDMRLQGLGLTSDGAELIQNIFVHIVRNSMDHGLETPEERKERSKPEQGTINLEARALENRLLLEFGDDGRGFNLPKIKQIAIDRGLISVDESLTREEIARLIFAEGFSTAKSVSDISGRGVGMGAVLQYIEDAGGELEIILLKSETDESVPFMFHIYLPQNLYRFASREEDQVSA